MGRLSSVLCDQALLIPRPTWTAKDIPDLTGQVIIVTGGNTGIGKATTKALLNHNATVYVTVRSQEKGDATVKEMKEVTGKEVKYLLMDLTDLKSVKAAAQDFQAKETKLHVLINNAGVMNPPLDAVTADGFDMQFGTNVVGHFYFIKLLLPTLLSTVEFTLEKKVRIVNVSSIGHELGKGKMDFKTFKDGPERRKLSEQGLYYQSKAGNVVVSNELAKRYGDQGIVSTSLHPGGIASDLSRNLGTVGDYVYGLLTYNTDTGALTQLRAATDPEGVNWNGMYLKPWARIGESHPLTHDAAIGQKLWHYLEEETKNV